MLFSVPSFLHHVGINYLMELFGLTVNSTVADLRKRYYNLALLCHPDHGGSADDMHVVQTSYEQAKALLQRQHESHAKVRTVQQALEEGALPPPLASEGTKPLPSFRDIFDEVHDGFHRKFHEHDAPLEGYVSYECDPHHVQGYGEYMVMQPAANVPPPPTDAELAAAQGVAPYDPQTAFVTDPPLLPLRVPARCTDVHTATNTDLPPSPPPSPTSALTLQNNVTPSVGFPVHVDPLQHVKDFSVRGSSTLPRTDYRLAMTHADGNTPAPTKTWLEAHLPSVRDNGHGETQADVVGTDNNTLRLRFANGDDESHEWWVRFAMSSTESYTPTPHIERVPLSHVHNISDVQRHVTAQWVLWEQTRSSDELLPALVETLRAWGKTKTKEKVD